MAESATLRPEAEAEAVPTGRPEGGWCGAGVRLTALFGALACLGMVMVASAAAGVDGGTDALAETVKRRLLWTAIGVIAFGVGACVNYQRWRRHHLAIAALAFAGLLILLVPGVGATVNGARRWIRFGGRIGVQPSEFAKVALIIWTAAWCERCVWTRNPRNGEPMIRSFARGFLVPMGVAGAASVLVLGEPDFGTAVLIGLLCTVMLLACGTRLVYVMLALLAAAPLAHRMVVGEPYRMQRLLAFMDPWSDPEGAGYQLIQSLIALGSGGLTGKGLGMGVQKMGFLPAANNDFIFAMIGEELGFVGAAALLALYVWVLCEGLAVALRARDSFGFALAFGLTMLLGVQTAVNVAVVTGALPTKGLSLPLVSAGGSSLVVTLWAAGILVNVARSVEAPREFELTPWPRDVPGYEARLWSAARALATRRAVKEA